MSRFAWGIQIHWQNVFLNSIPQQLKSALNPFSLQFPLLAASVPVTSPGRNFPLLGRRISSMLLYSPSATPRDSAPHVEARESQDDSLWFGGKVL